MSHVVDTDADFIADALANGVQGGAAVDGAGGSPRHDTGEDIAVP